MIDRKLCELLIQEYYTDVMNFCRAKLRDEEAAKDCAQETFILFFEKRQRLDLTENIKAWLLSAAARIIKSHRRNSWRRVDDGEGVIDRLPASEDIQRSAEMKSALSQLTSEEAQLLIRYYQSDKESRQRLADELGITLNNLYIRIRRIKSKISNKIDK